MRSNASHLLALVSWLALASSIEAASVTSLFSVKDYGATGDGARMETSSINAAIDACAAAGGGTVYLPPGKYLTGTVVLKNHVSLQLDAGAVLLGSEDPKDYLLIDDPWDDTTKTIAPLIYADHATNITLTGRGTIDGQGQVWWKRQWLAHPKRGMPEATSPEDEAEAKKIDNGRPRLIRLVHCQDVVIEKLTLKNSGMWTVNPLFCGFVRVDGVTVLNPVPSPNTDGINPESCRNVQIINCRIDVGDDCVTLKSGMDAVGRRVGMPDENITIANCVMLRGHGGVTIGSEMSGGVRNVTVANCVFQGTDIGIRVKSQRGRGGVVEGVTVDNITMENVPHPFVITTFYMGKDRPEDHFTVGEGTPRFRDFLFSNIEARGALDAGSITGLRELPVEDIAFSNVRISAGKGFTCTDARHVGFYDVEINPSNGPAMILRDASETDTTRLRSRTLSADTPLVQTNLSR
ncbi:MAG TPA: glycoside hydrolase family 28 protein [Verrucomicrobiae bacterium]|jgi:polygalacturonase|nr:glycoside hydrolase family 28 protein [Verrucomicrobiae bacterium]